MDVIFSKFDFMKHPDLRIGLKTKEEVKDEFMSTFKSHHHIMHGYQALDKVQKQEFIEYYAHVSAAMKTDSSF